MVSNATEKGAAESSKVLILSAVRLDQGVLNGESGLVAPLGDEVNSSILMFVEPVTTGFSQSVLFVDRDESLQNRPLFPGFCRYCSSRHG